MRTLGEYFSTMASCVLAMPAGTLPKRWWSVMDRRVPVSRCGVAAGIATLVVGLSILIPGYLRHLQENTARGATMVAQAGGWIPSTGATPTDAGANAVFMLSYMSPLTFLFTPLGIFSVYLSVTGFLRAVSAHVDDPRGDPVLTFVDGLWVKVRHRASTRRGVRTREELEGPEVPDRLVPGTTAGFPDADFVVVASRRKPGWERGVFIITPDLWYRVGTPTEMTLHGGLRTLYPLTEIRDLEVMRRSVEYVLPPLSGASRLTVEKSAR